MYSYVLLTLGAFATYASAANVCTDGAEYSSKVIWTPADVAQYEKCPVITENLSVYREYEGAFELAGPKNLDGFTAGSPGGSHSAPNQGPGQVTSVSMPDLETVSYITITNAPYLQSISFPKLKSASGNQGVYISVSKGSKLSLPSLESVSSWLSLSGPFDEIELPKLQKVEALKIKSWGKFDCVAYWGQVQKSVTLTTEYQDWTPAFECESSLNSAKSPLIPRTTTTSPTATSTSATTDATASASATDDSTTRTTSTLTSSTTVTAVAPHSSSSTSLITSWVAAPTGFSNSTAPRTSTTRRPAPTGLPAPLTTSGASIFTSRVWDCVGMMLMVTMGFMLL